jgi:hypothetical protein
MLAVLEPLGARNDWTFHILETVTVDSDGANTFLHVFSLLEHPFFFARWWSCVLLNIYIPFSACNLFTVRLSSATASGFTLFVISHTRVFTVELSICARLDVCTQVTCDSLRVLCDH